MAHDGQAFVQGTRGGMHRRRFLALAGGMAGAAILAACGGDTPVPTATAARPTTGAAPTTGVVSAGSVPAPTAATGSVVAPAGGASATTGATRTAAPSVVTGATTPATGSAAVATRATTGSAVVPATGGSAVAGTSLNPTGVIPVLDIEAFDYGFRTVGSVPAGPTLVRQRNTGKENHHAQLIRLKSGTTQEQLLAALPKGEAAIFALTQNAGGPGAVAGGGVSEVITSLQEGDHALICYIPSPTDGLRHFAKGMILPLGITAAPPSAAAVKLPETVGTVVMSDFAFTLPVGTVKPGKSYWTVVNEGMQPHEFNIVRLQPGKTPADISAFFAGPPMGPPPFVSAGGFNGVERGGDGIAVLDLQAGEYAAICNIPDVNGSGKSHLQLGMIAGLSVKE